LMENPFPVLIFLPPDTNSRAERWVAAGRRAAAADLIKRLKSIEFDLEIHLISADSIASDALGQGAKKLTRTSATGFHFGNYLTHYLEENNIQRAAYFGGASAPLMTAEMLSDAIGAVLVETQPFAMVNNLYSTDWAIFNHAQRLHNLRERLPADNQLGWVMLNEGGFHVEALPPGAASRVDVDTPSDLILLSGHPFLGPALNEFLVSEVSGEDARVGRVKDLLKTPASSLVVIGRSSSRVWAELERRTQIWVRVFVEERGMVSSGRMAKGEVRSLIGQMLEDQGAEIFLGRLSELGGAVLWDTRVWMAHQGGWPSTADRFAADLGWTEEIEHVGLRKLTREIMSASIPVITGGHGVVSGLVYALLDACDL
jgi:hypothetical protein